MSYNHMNSRGAGGHQIDSETHCSTADHQAHQVFAVILFPAKQAAPPAFSAACISREDATRAEAIKISSFLSSDCCSCRQKRSC